MPLDLTDYKSTLVQVMAWCRQAPSHYLSQCWPRSMSPNGVTRPQWVNSLWYSDAIWSRRSGSTLSLAQVMIWCLMAPRHCLNQYCLIISINSMAFTWEQFHRKMLQTWIHKMSSKIIPLNYRQNFPGSNGLIWTLFASHVSYKFIKLCMIAW